MKAAALSWRADRRARYWSLAIISLACFLASSCLSGRYQPTIPKNLLVTKNLKYTESMSGSSPKDYRLDLYRPASQDRLSPLIVWFHSGAWNSLDKSCIEQAVIDQVARGYAVASVDYPLSFQAIWPAQLEAAKTAIRWLRSHAAEYGLDPSKFIAWGLSAGGHLAAMVGVSGSPAKRDDVQAVITWCAPVDLTRLSGSARQAAASLFGTGAIPDRAGAAAANPADGIGSDVPPFYIVQGTQDEVVGPEHGRLLAAAILARGGTAIMTEIPGYAHADIRFNNPEHRASLNQFLNAVAP